MPKGQEAYITLPTATLGPAARRKAMDIDDCIIVGAGPAGLTAAIYLARYHLSIRMFDCGTSRAGWIPANPGGYPT